MTKDKSVKVGHLVPCQQCNGAGYINGAVPRYTSLAQYQALGAVTNQAMFCVPTDASFRPILCPSCGGTREVAVVAK